MTSTEFIVRDKFTSTHQVTASVGFISPEQQPNTFVVVRNKRGWDIPGGHALEGETPPQTLERELLEETGCILLPGVVLIAFLESVTHPETGIAVYQGQCRVGSFEPTEEILERDFFTREQLVSHYFGDVQLLQMLLDLCQ